MYAYLRICFLINTLFKKLLRLTFILVTLRSCNINLFICLYDLLNCENGTRNLLQYIRSRITKNGLG